MRSNDLRFVTDCRLMDIEWIQSELTAKSYWAKGRTQKQVLRSIENSHAFGVFRELRQIAFARVVTDLVSVAYIADVWVEESERGNGIGRWMLEQIFGFVLFSEVKRWLLVTKDAQGIYREFGFSRLNAPEEYMERLLNTGGVDGSN